MLRFPLFSHCLIAALAATINLPQAQSGIYLTHESWNELPSQWRGFLLDHRQLLRVLTTPVGQKPTTLALQYRQSIQNLKDLQKKRGLSADESADLGGLLLRVGENNHALEVLQSAHRKNPDHFRLTSHLAMAWFAQNQMDQALAYQKESIRLAPGKCLPGEESLAKLIQSRIKEPKRTMDDLFGLTFDGLVESVTQSKPWPGRERFPSDTLARVQILALWLPNDPRALAQAGVFCAVFGDTKQASQILEGAVTEFGIRDPLVMRLRQVCKDSKPIDHGKHPAVRFRSARPLDDPLESETLPTIEPGKPTEIPWVVFSKTRLSPKRPPEFPKYLNLLDGKEIILDGYLQPFGENLDEGRFLLVENAVGCWWCDMPDLTGMLRIDLMENQALPPLRRSVRVTGKLRLNSKDPEAHLFALEEAQVKTLD